MEWFYTQNVTKHRAKTKENVSSIILKLCSEKSDTRLQEARQ